MKTKLCVLILFLSVLAMAQPNVGPGVRRPCTSTVTTSCTPQVSSAGAYIPYVVGGSGANPLGLFVVAGAANAPANAVNLALLSSGLLKMTVAGGVATLTTAGAGSDYVAPGGNVATATDLATYPSLCTGTQFSQGLSHGSNNCGTPAGGGSMTWPAAAGFALYGGSSAWGTSFVPASTAVPFGTGSTFSQDATNFSYTTGTHALAITGPITASSFGTSSATFGASGTENTKPAAPAASQEIMWFDSTDHVLHGQGSGGTETWTAAVPLAAPGSDHKWVFYVDTTGTQQRTQPAMGDISGTLGLAAGGTNVDLSTAGGAVNTTGAQVLHENASHVISSSAIAAADIPSGLRARGVGMSFNGGGSAIALNSISYIAAVPFAGTISAWDLCVDTGTATVDVFKIATGTGLPTASITASATPAIASNNCLHSATLTGWTTSIAAGDRLAFEVTAISAAKNISIVLEVDQ